MDAHYIQFIPIVEIDDKNLVTDRTVNPKQYGEFLIKIFDEWIRRDVGKTFVQFFDGVLASYVRGFSSLCVLRPTCGEGVALEHNGDVYSCDHFVDPKYLLGNIHKESMIDLVSSDQQLDFGRRKQSALPNYCRECEFCFTCHGECPKNRILKTSNGEDGLNYLCKGLKDFFVHTKSQMEIMAQLLRAGRPASDIMKMQKEHKSDKKIGRNDLCPCGSGLKYKRCHGR